MSGLFFVCFLELNISGKYSLFPVAFLKVKLYRINFELIWRRLKGKVASRCRDILFSGNQRRNSYSQDKTRLQLLASLH